MQIGLILTVAVALGFASAAQSQGLARGAQDGAERGGNIAGPLGAAVGSAIGGTVGAANEILGVDRRERFRIYTLAERRPSVSFKGTVRVGTILPEDGVIYYDVPPEFALQGLNYAIVNGHSVLVEPATRRIVEVIN